MLISLTLAAASLTPSPAILDDGQGPADPDARIEQLGFGQVVHGPVVDAEDLRGRVVLVVFGGS